MKTTAFPKRPLARTGVSVLAAFGIVASAVFLHGATTSAVSHKSAARSAVSVADNSAQCVPDPDTGQCVYPAPPSPAQTASTVNGSDDYPWKGYTGGNIFGGFGQCVSFVAWKIYENSGGSQVPATWQPPTDWQKYSIDVNDNWGDAYNWGYYARGNNVHVGSTPHPGAVAWWDKTGVWAAHGTGHVAYVTSVSTDSAGNVTGFDIAQYNIEGTDLAYSTAHFDVSNGQKVSSVNTTTAGPDKGLDFSWIPMPDGFIDINDGY